MDAPDVISFLAAAEARRMRPITDDDELVRLAEDGKALPFFRISKDAMGRLRVEGGGHAGHDNEGRMPFVCDFVQRRVLPLLSTDPSVGSDGPFGPKAGRHGAERPAVCGTYRLELHDAYSYLPNAAEYENALSFGRARDARESVALFPDPYQMGDYGGLLTLADEVPWTLKSPVMFFAGTTTGDRAPEKNARIRACVWSLAHRDVSLFLITKVAQMGVEEACARVPDLRRTFHGHVPIREGHGFRYGVNIVGNTACWSRVPQILCSKSVMFHVRHADATWYYPALQEGVHFVGVDAVEDLPAKRAFCEGNPGFCQAVTLNANRFCHGFLDSSHAASYAAQLLGSWSF